jgi:hypothetical protein
MKLIEELEGLQLIHMKGKETFVLPHTLHCVLTFEVSVHARTQIWSFNLFNDSKRIMEWETRRAINYDTNGYNYEDAVDLFKDIQGIGVQKYKELAKAFPEHPRAPEVLSWATQMERKIIDSLAAMERANRSENTSKKRQSVSGKRHGR